MGLDHRVNLGYFDGFMRAYGAADRVTRTELYRDTLAYSVGRETAGDLYQQVYALLGIAAPSPQVYVGA